MCNKAKCANQVALDCSRDLVMCSKRCFIFLSGTDKQTDWCNQACLILEIIKVVFSTLQQKIYRPRMIIFMMFYTTKSFSSSTNFKISISWFLKNQLNLVGPFSWKLASLPQVFQSLPSFYDFLWCPSLSLFSL
jgi:hypothetical protein